MFALALDTRDRESHCSLSIHVTLLRTLVHQLPCGGSVSPYYMPYNRSLRDIGISAATEVLIKGSTPFQLIER